MYPVLLCEYREICVYFALNTGHCIIHIYVQRKYIVGIFAEYLEVHLFPARYYSNSTCAATCPYHSRVIPILWGYITHERAACMHIWLKVFSLPVLCPARHCGRNSVLPALRSKLWFTLNFFDFYQVYRRKKVSTPKHEFNFINSTINMSCQLIYLVV